LASKIAFVSTRDGHQEIYVMDADGSGATRLTFAAPRFSNFSPNWSGRAADRVHERPRPRVRALRDGTRRIRADAGDGPDQFIRRRRRSDMVARCGADRVHELPLRPDRRG